MRLRRRVIYVLRIALSSAMMISSRMSMANLSARFMTNSESSTLAFATLRFAGNALDPGEISRVLKEEPTRAYRKGQRFRPGPRSPEITGKTGIWYFSTRRKIPGNDLVDHLDALVRLILPFGDSEQPPERASRYYGTGPS